MSDEHLFQSVIYSFNCLQTPQDSYWTEESDNSDPGYPRRFTHAYKALDDFEAWMNENEDSLPPFDAAMLFSGWVIDKDIKSSSVHRLFYINELINDIKWIFYLRLLSNTSSIAISLVTYYALGKW